MPLLSVGWGIWGVDLVFGASYAFVKRWFRGFDVALVGGMPWFGGFDVTLVGGYAFVKPWVICLG
jgi:hypothetical protein